MRGTRMSIAEQDAEMARLEELQRQRPLTDEESAIVANLVYRAQLRAYRAHSQMRAALAKVALYQARAA